MRPTTANTSAMAAIRISSLGLAPTACCTTDYPRGALHGSVQIGAQMFHVEAYQVKPLSDGSVAPVLPDYTDEVEALYTLSQSSLSTQKIGGVEYVIAIFPHAA